MVQLELGSEVGNTHVTGGRVSISVDEPRCEGTLEQPCVYTINEVRLEALDPFAMAGISFAGVVVGTTGPAFNQFQTVLGASAVRGLPFYVIGNADGHRFSYFVAENPASYLSVGDLQMGPDRSSAVLFGHLEGTINGQPGVIRFSATADTPFENRPPYLDPVAPAEVATACVAPVTIDAGLRDTDGDVIATWAEMEGFGIGGVAGPVQLPIGDHTVTVAAEDRYHALGRGEVNVRVVSDGTLATDAGTEVLTFNLPHGASGDALALLAEGDISLSPGTNVASTSGGGAVASFGGLTLAPDASTGEAWAAGSATLGNRAHVHGALHVGGTLRAASSAVVDGGVLHDGPYTPLDTVRFIIPSSGAGEPLSLGPGETATLSAGHHGAVEIAPRARLVLGEGMHTVTSLSVGPGAELVVSGDSTTPTILRVEGALSWHGAVAGTGGPALALVLVSSAAARLHSSFNGWIFAPSAEVTLLPGASPHRGAVFARAIRTQPNVVIEHVAPAFAVPDGVVDACAVTPVVTCVRENVDGTLVAVFGYTSLLDNIGVWVPRGPINRLHPALIPSTDHQYFAPRGDDSAFEVTFTDRVQWILGGRTAVANAESMRCH